MSVAMSAVILSLALVQVQSGGVAILRWFLACLQASFQVLLTLLLPLRRRAVGRIKMVKGALAKRSPLPRRGGGKKQPVSPGAASTNSESPYWQRGVVLPQDPLELFGMLLHIVRTVSLLFRHPNDLVEAIMLPPDHYGCCLACTRFTGRLAAFEEHERGCAHWLSIISFPKVCNATSSSATKTS